MGWSCILRLTAEAVLGKKDDPMPCSPEPEFEYIWGDHDVRGLVVRVHPHPAGICSADGCTLARVRRARYETWRINLLASPFTVQYMV